MARRTVFVSDFSNSEIADEKEAVQIVLRYTDGRRGQVVADAHVKDEIVKQIEAVGVKQVKRGRPSKAAN